MSSHSEALERFFPTPSVDSKPTNGVVTSGNVVAFPGARENGLKKTVGLLALQGQSCSEIAHILDKPIELVQTLYNDEETQKLFAREIEAKGKFALKKLAAGAAVDAVIVLQSIVTNPKSKDSDRIAAGRELLDRSFGKPAPASKHGDGNDDGFVGDDPEAALIRIRAELDERRKSREKKLNPTPNIQ
jgi:hypothetical protein